MEELFPYEKEKCDIILKVKDIPEPEPKEKSVPELLNCGIINIDKPAGPTSHQVSGYVKQILNIKKCGHSGTLDPGVTGVLPIALGRSTKVIQALLTAGKEYVGIMHLHKDVPEKEIIDVFKDFTGEIVQLPPVRSAVKRRKRKRTVYYLKLLEKKEKDVLFKVGCEAGTYIRKLCHDIGIKLGVGANMKELRRTRVAAFREDTLITLQDLKDAYYYYKNGNEKFIRSIILPLEMAVRHLPKVWVFDTAIESLKHGRDLAVPGIIKFESCIKKGRLTAIMSLNNDLIALGNALMSSDEIASATKGIAVPTHKVFV